MNKKIKDKIKLDPFEAIYTHVKDYDFQEEDLNDGETDSEIDSKDLSEMERVIKSEIDDAPQLLGRDFGLTYTQKNDCCDNNKSGQYLEIKIQNGGSPLEDEFVVIETKRWAANNIDEIINLLQQFKTEYEKIKK